MSIPINADADKPYSRELSNHCFFIRSQSREKLNVFCITSFLEGGLNFSLVSNDSLVQHFQVKLCVFSINIVGNNGISL